MTKERFEWYQNEILRLRKLDKLITDRARATYSLSSTKLSTKKTK